MEMYKKLRRQYLEMNTMCHAKLKNCTLKATDVHHMQGRGKNLLKVATWLPLCRNCHEWVERNPEMAKELGYSKDRNY